MDEPMSPTVAVQAGKDVLDNHGFNALLVVLLLAGFFYLGKLFFSVWKTNNDRITASQEKYIDSQISFSEQNNRAIDKIAELMEKNSNTLDRITINGESIEIESRAGNRNVERIHEAVRQTLVLAADTLTDRPDIQTRLRGIADTLKTG